MKAALLRKIGEQLSIEKVKVPNLKANEVAIKIKAAGICNSDINYRDGVSPVARLPIILGHEISGQVVDTGEKVEEIKEEDRVCVHYVISCGKCKFCRINRENLCEEYQMKGQRCGWRIR